MPEPFLQSMIAQGFSGLFSTLVRSLLDKARAPSASSADDITIDLEPHMEVTFNKCIKIKTIINESPVDFLAIYVPQNFLLSTQTIDHYAVIDAVRRGECAIIQGTGGGGKSMFMRYLWISFFVKSDGKIPVFFELRHTSHLSHSNFSDYLYHHIIQTKARISSHDFHIALSKGDFVLFLDGFDEIVTEKKNEIERSIILLKEANPKLTIVVSSRADDRFRGWHQFQSYEVAPLTKEQAIALIDTAEYDDVSRKRLIKRLKNGLYESHDSFLSNPLLAYMMLLTIARNPDIPNKMHLFYEQAFDALYHRHDVVKGGYIRQFHSNMDRDSFIRQMAYLSLITYHDMPASLSEDTIINYIRRAAKFDGIDVDPASFLKDLTDSVCIFKRDGLEYDFIHRSFQEYFAALCIARIASRNLERLFANFSQRYGDQVMKMVYDINPDLFREKYVSVVAAKYMPFLANHIDGRDELVFLEAIFGRFFCRTVGKRKAKSVIRHEEMEVMLDARGDMYALQEIVRKIRPDRSYQHKSKDYLVAREQGRARDRVFFRNLADVYGVELESISVLSDGEDLIIDAAGNIIDPTSHMQEFKKTYMFQWLGERARDVRDFVAEETEKYRTVSESFEEYFGEA